MPNGYGGHSGYGRGGGYRSSYQYQQPQAFQYESFFNPIPLDFIGKQLDKRQEAYDVAFAGGLAAKQQAAQQQVGMKDIAQKNKLINESVKRMDEFADKYDGNYAAAAKEIAAEATVLHSSPFWNAAKEADRYRKIAEEQKIKYGPNAMIFNDPTLLSVVDEEGNIRGAEQFKPDIIQKGDYGKTAMEIMSTVVADAGFYSLSRVEAQGLEHFLKTGKYEMISKEKIEEIANKPEVQQLFLGRHPEIERGIGELDEEQQERFGFTGRTPEQFAKEQLLGAGLSRVYTQRDARYQVDPVAAARAKDAVGPVRVWGTDITNVAQEGTTVDDQKRQRRLFDVYRAEGTNNLMTRTEWEKEKKQREAFHQATLKTGEGVNLFHKFDMEREDYRYDQSRSLIDDLRKSNTHLPGVKDMEDGELLDAYYADMEKFALEGDKLTPIVNDDIAEGLGRDLASKMASGVEFLLEGEGLELDLTGRKGIAEELNMDEFVLRNYLQDQKPDYGYNNDKAMFYVELSQFKNKKTNTKWSEDVDTKDFRKVYFAPDDNSKLISDGVQTLERSLIDRVSYNRTLPIEGGFMEINYGAEGTKAIGRDIHNDRLIHVSVYDENGNLQRQGSTSLNSVKKIAKDFQRYNLEQNYVRTEME